MTTTTSALRDILIETLYSEFIDKVQLAELVEFNQLITQLKDEFRVYLASPEVVASQLWPLIRRQESLFNLTLRLSMNFYFRLRERELVDLFDRSISAMSLAYANVEEMKDNDLKEKVAEATELARLPGLIKFIFYCLLEVRLLVELEAKVQSK